MKSRPRLRKTALPHIFTCQKEQIIITERKAAIKRKHIELVGEAEEEYEKRKALNSAEGDMEIPNTSTSNTDIDPVKATLDKAVQVNIRSFFRSKGTNTTQKMKDEYLSPIKFSTECAAQTSTQMSPLLKVKKVLLDQSDDESSSSSSQETNETEFSIEQDISSTSDVEEKNMIVKYENENLQKSMRNSFLMSIEKNPKLFLGLPSQSYSLLDLLSVKIPSPLINILITLKKIRLDDPFTILGVHFGMSSTSASRIFRRTVEIMVPFMQQLIVWPQKDRVQMHLPISFRSRYGKVMSIIDCLEIQIEKPTNPVHQALTWSQYKNANTVKYLISCTPDGLVNYISSGYGGRATDVTITEDCGYLDKLEPGTAVMADRGFKNLSELLQKKNCHLIRPPSVSANQASSAQEVKETKRIAALRVHVERVIGRLREFNMLRPHACIDNHHIQIADFIIILACGIINIQDHLFKDQI